MLNGNKTRKPRNLVFLAMRMTRKAVIHGRVKKAERRAAKQNLMKELSDA